MVSKLTVMNEISQTEIEVGVILKQSPHYEDNFVLVERQCPVQYKSLSEMKQGCDMVKKKNAYVLLYSRYVKSKELYDYLKENTLFVRMYRCFYQLCEKVATLIEYRIVHHDLHLGNILYGTETAKLYIIDFGLSILVDKLQDPAYLKHTFSRYMPEWHWYPLDIHLLCYLVQHGEFTKEVLLSMLEIYLKDHRVFSLFQGYRKEYRRVCLETYLPWVGRTREECIAYLLTFWNTWDYFDVGLRFLNMYGQNQLNYPEYFHTLSRMVHPNPEKRPTVLHLRNQNKQTIQSFDVNLSKTTYASIDKQLSMPSKKN
jgi:tRNA A-37 threonylcarbamoyl transferase component Bud32